MIHTYKPEREDGRLTGRYEVGVWEPAYYTNGEPFQAWRLLHLCVGVTRAMKLVNSLNGGEYCDPDVWVMK